MATLNGCNMDLKELLAEWKLENILTHLIAEQIDVNILEMMKLSHIRLLLHNFPLGVQIRFEYYLERSRRDSDRHASKPNNDILKQSSQMQSKSIQTDLTMLDVNSNSHKNTASSRHSNHSNSSTAPTITINQYRLKSNKYTPNGSYPKIDLRKILTLVPCGVELTNSYRERKSFTNAERRQLISVIVNYYFDNRIKFNLLTSYAVERSILQMFPNEKLEMYRTSKRGKLYSKYINAKAAMKFMRAGIRPNDNSDMDFGDTCGGDSIKLNNVSDDSHMLFVNNTANSMAHLDDEDEDTFMEDDGYAADIIAEGIQPTITEGEFKPDIKIEPEKVSETPFIQPVVLSTELLFNRRKPEEADRPFENFHVPWHKVPSDVLSMLEKQQKLGKRLNALANLFVDELRSICTHVPMRVFRNVTQQVVSKYPFSFLDKDSEGNIISSATVPLMQRMRNRNNFLNR